MGVIRWEEIKGGPYDDDVMWHGYLGDDCICFVAEYDGWTMFTHREFPGLIHEEGHRPCDDLEHGKTMAEGLLRGWMAAAGLVSKAELDDANAAYSGLYTEFLARIDQALGLAKDLRWSQSEVDRIKRESKHRLDEIRDLQAENAVLKERIGAAFGDIDDAITALKRKADDIVDDLGIARTWSWDVPVDQWWNGAKPKQRTEGDYRDADIEERCCVTFRDGGAA